MDFINVADLINCILVLKSRVGVIVRYVYITLYSFVFMNKRAEGILYDNIIYAFLFILFFMLMFYFITGYQDGATFWEDFYAKEISLMINRAEPGMEIAVDVSNLAVIAIKNGKSYREIISIDNVNNRVSVSVRNGAGTSYGFFKDFDIVEPRVEIPSGGATTTRFIFKIKERQREIPQV